MQTETTIPKWIRWTSALLLGLPHISIGLWGLLQRESFYNDFPGVEPSIIDAWPPFNDHLINDTAIGFLATGSGLVLAAALGDRSANVIALFTFLVFVVPHLVFHLLNPSELMTASENLTNNLFLASSPALAALLLVAIYRSDSPPPGTP